MNFHTSCCQLHIQTLDNKPVFRGYNSQLKFIVFSFAPLAAVTDQYRSAVAIPSRSCHRFSCKSIASLRQSPAPYHSFSLSFSLPLSLSNERVARFMAPLLAIAIMRTLRRNYSTARLLD